jgi:acetyltransferase-like isoleucine patch superfamily enzyme
MADRLKGVLASTLVASPVWSPRMRARLLGLLGVRLSGGARIDPGIRFIGGVDHLVVGRGAFINTDVTIGANADVVLGERVHLGPGVRLLPTTHEIGPHEQRAGATSGLPIRIGDGSWLGAGVTVLGGVTVGDGCVVAAGAVVHVDTEPDTVYGGVPARLIRRLPPKGQSPADPFHGDAPET